MNLSIAELFLLLWALVVTGLYFKSVARLKLYMVTTVRVCEDVAKGKAKFVFKTDEDGKHLTVEAIK